MTDGGREKVRTIRVVLPGCTADEADVGALKKWLDREPGLENLVGGERLRIELRPSAETRGAPMGAGLEILVVLLAAAGQPVFNDVYEMVKRGVGAWRQNRRSVEPGEPPDFRAVRDDDPHGPPHRPRPADPAGPADQDHDEE